MKNDDIQNVLASYEDASARPGDTPLEEWVERYPEHTGELVRFATYNYVFEHGIPYMVDRAEAGQESLFLSRAAAIRQRLMRQDGSLSTACSPLTSLLVAAKERSLTTPGLAQRLQLSPLEVVKLNQRLFRAATLPKALVAQLAVLLDRSFQEVAAYLRQPAMLAAQASYRAEAAPRVGEQEDFRTAVASSRNLTDAQKAQWLAADEALLGDLEE